MRFKRRTVGMVVAAVLAIGVLAPAAVLAVSQTFTDVPPDDWGFEDVEWLASVGLTNGCGDGTTYCPDDGVTRREMAAFTHRVAQKLLPTMVVAEAEGVKPVDTPTKLAEASFVAEAPSTVSITAAATGSYLSDVGAAGYSDLYMWIQIDDTTCTAAPLRYFAGIATFGEPGIEPFYATASIVDATTVTAGSHTLTMCGETEADGDKANVWRAAASAIVIPDTMSQIVTPLSAPTDVDRSSPDEARG